MHVRAGARRAAQPEDLVEIRHRREPSGCAPTCSRAQAIIASCADGSGASIAPADDRTPPAAARPRCGNAARRELAAHAVRADLVQLVDRDERRIVKVGRHAERRPACPVSSPRWFSRMTKSRNPSSRSTSLTAAADLRLDDRRRRPDRVDVALVELAEPPARRPVRPPHRLNLVALEELRQLAAMLGDDARERHGEVVAQRQVGLARRLVLAAAQHLEDQLVAFFAVLAGQRLDVLERRRLERLEAVAPVDVRR